ncbi:MAG: 2Fe-2S iron-sulfur cluster-binding protein, partial [Planctomycetota bacterium]
MISLTVDGIPVEVEPGSTILDAAKKAGVTIPTLCH